MPRAAVSGLRGNPGLLYVVGCSAGLCQHRAGGRFFKTGCSQGLITFYCVQLQPGNGAGPSCCGIVADLLQRETLSYGSKRYSELVLYSCGLELWRIRFSLFDLCDSYVSVTSSSSHSQRPTTILPSSRWCLSCSDRSRHLHRLSRNGRYCHMVDCPLLCCLNWLLSLSRVWDGVK